MRWYFFKQTKTTIFPHDSWKFMLKFFLKSTRFQTGFEFSWFMKYFAFSIKNAMHDFLWWMFNFVQLWNTFHDAEYVEKAFERSFNNLNLGYVDLYLMHYPIAYRWGYHPERITVGLNILFNTFIGFLYHYSRVIEHSRLPANDVNAFYVFPFENGASLPCLTSQILYHVFSATRLFCNYHSFVTRILSF